MAVGSNIQDRDVRPEVKLERIGLVLVHGIGDQDRHAHLQGVARDLLKTLVVLYGKTSVSIQMLPGVGGNSDLSILVKINDNYYKVIDFHEMWWRDLGQKSNPLNVVQFWLWAATFFGTRGRFFSGERTVTSPPINRSTDLGRVRAVDRIVLFFKITYFFILLFPLRIGATLINILPGIRPINLFRTIFTYMSSVQMYQQRRGKKGGTLVDYDQSKRMSIQRRFANLLVDVNERNYDRWYVMGHSLGSVIALKGLMTPETAFASYMSFDKWHHEHMGLRDNSIENGDYPEKPRRPIWLDESSSLNTEALFKRCAGLVTWGSPLETFAKTWPEMVHTLNNPKFGPSFEWINFYDDVDVISSKLTSFDGLPIDFRPQNYSCSSSRWVFKSHTNYFYHPKSKEEAASKKTPSIALIHWLLDGSSNFETVAQRVGFEETNGRKRTARRALASLQWILALVVGLLVWPLATGLFIKAVAFLPRQALGLLGSSNVPIEGEINAEPSMQDNFDSYVNAALDHLSNLKPTSDIFLDLTNFIYISGIVCVVLLGGGLAHNLFDWVLQKRAESKRRVVNEEITLEE